MYTVYELYIGIRNDSLSKLVEKSLHLWINLTSITFSNFKSDDRPM